ncbi:MAG TPA: cupin domain-containing protein [Micromonosporaceae bacterium]|jgi:mannose-6-phosphate isomerase-like protein (cupin superfamily)
MDTIVNPLSGEEITIEPERSGDLVWQLRLAVGGRVPSSHAHPEQEERFEILHGRMGFRVNGRRRIATAGQTVVVPPGTVHSFRNAGAVPVLVRVTTSPALAMADLLSTAAAMADDQQARGDSRPGLLELALFMREFEREVRAPYLPSVVVRVVMRTLARLARATGRDGGYLAARSR